MHDDEIDVDAALVARLIEAQFPEWAGLTIEPLLPWGTDNALFRLGLDRIVRLPRIDWAVGQVEKDLRWLPVIAPRLPLAIPEPIVAGRPSDTYPWVWGVYRWLEGETLPADRLGEARGTASDLAGFLSALRQIDTAAGPAAGPPNSSRGVPLGTRDEAVRAAVAELGDTVDNEAVTAIWEDALQASEWHDAPTWLHGDLLPGNLLFVDGRLRAVIDFASLCVGDPACDLMVAWTFLTARTRPELRVALDVDDDAWVRGRGWALSWALIALPYYRETNPTLASYARRTLAEVLADSMG